MTESSTALRPAGATAARPTSRLSRLFVPSPTNPLRMPPRGSPPSVYPVPREQRSKALLRGLPIPGLTVALVMLWIALTPSLLPRTWWMTAINVGVSVTFGYLIGQLLGRLASWVALRTDLQVRINARADWAFRVLWVLLLVMLSVVAWVNGVRQQQVISDLVGVPNGGNLSQLVGLVAGLALFGVLVLLGRAVMSLWRAVRRVVRPVVPNVIAPVVAAVLVGGLLYFVSDQVVYQRGMNWALGNAQRTNALPSKGGERDQPVEPERSGSPASNEEWGLLGRDGQAFVADGPRAVDIERGTGEPAMEPIRAYAGKAQHDQIDEAAAAAVAELVRAGGLERSVVHVTISTGTGFVQEWSVEALEFLTGGDVATVSMQYSYFPSSLAYISDRETPPDAGRTLFTQMEAALAALPEHERPRLVLSGESLGSFGGQGAFESADDMLARIDGAVWTGTPRFTPMWSALTESRRQGSPEIAPVIDNGRHIRFMTRPEELTHDYHGAPFVDWQEPRIVYGQHASDPVVWWSPQLLWQEPDWLQETPGRDVSPRLAWTFYVTFWQIATDMPLAVDVPPGHGHEYKDELVPAWAGVLGQDPVADYSDIIEVMEELIIPR